MKELIKDLMKVPLIFGLPLALVLGLFDCAALMPRAPVTCEGWNAGYCYCAVRNERGETVGGFAVSCDAVPARRIGK